MGVEFVGVVDDDECAGRRFPLSCGEFGDGGARVVGYMVGVALAVGRRECGLGRGDGEHARAAVVGGQGDCPQNLAALTTEAACCLGEVWVQGCFGGVEGPFDAA